MSNIEPELLGLLVKDAIEGDIKGVRAYAGLIAGNLAYANDTEGAEEINKVLEGRYKEV